MPLQMAVGMRCGSLKVEICDMTEWRPGAAAVYGVRQPRLPRLVMEPSAPRHDTLTGHENRFSILIKY